MSNRWKTLSYLKNGNTRQKSAFKILEELQVFKFMQNYNPVLVGTIPIGIDTADSDLDIICEVYRFDEFEAKVKNCFGKHKDFSISNLKANGLKTVFSRFKYNGFSIEVFGQPKHVTQQNAYLHMVVEKRLLDLGGKELKNEIIKLKRAGIKTEPAFAKVLKLQGDPYEELLS